MQLYPKGFPEIVYPADNIPTSSRIELGRKLFFDPILSKDSSISCASCHLPEYAFSDTVAISLGVNGATGFRNSYSLINVAYQRVLFMDGGVPRLELQVLAPLGAGTEQEILISEGAKRLEENKEYQKLSREAYGRDLDPFVITRAIAAYERTLIAGNSRYDRYMNGEEHALNEEEIAGAKIFNGKGNCVLCHSGFLMTDQSFQNIGLYETYEDIGRQRITDESKDNGKFKVPSLRNVNLTAPYMHDGSMESLEEVIDHFNSGGKVHEQKSAFIKPLGLSQLEKMQLLAFLLTLEDTRIYGNNE